MDPRLPAHTQLLWLLFLSSFPPLEDFSFFCARTAYIKTNIYDAAAADDDDNDDFDYSLPNICMTL